MSRSDSIDANWFVICPVLLVKLVDVWSAVVIILS